MNLVFKSPSIHPVSPWSMILNCSTSLLLCFKILKCLQREFLLDTLDVGNSWSTWYEEFVFGCISCFWNMIKTYVKADYLYFILLLLLCLDLDKLSLEGDRSQQLTLNLLLRSSPVCEQTCHHTFQAALRNEFVFPQHFSILRRQTFLLLWINPITKHLQTCNNSCSAKFQ